MLQLKDKVNSTKLEEVAMTFKDKDNVRAIKGVAMKYLTPEERKCTQLSSLRVYHQGQLLTNKQNLATLNVTDHAFMVEYQ